MGNLWSVVEPPPPPPPMVLVPPLFDFPPLAARTRMLESSYNMLFGKLALRLSLPMPSMQCFGPLMPSIAISRLFDDTLVSSMTHRYQVAGPLDHKPEEKIVGNAQFRWQSDVDDPHTFVDLFVSSAEPTLLVRSCAYYPKFGFGAFGIFPVLMKQRLYPDDYGVMGLRYGSSNMSVGAEVFPFAVSYNISTVYADTISEFHIFGFKYLVAGDELPKTAWLVSKMGRLTAGVQYEPKFGSKDVARYRNLANWSCAIGYGLGSGSPLSPSFNFGLELAKNSQFIASFYQHVVVQRRVKNPLEENEVVGITNYIDFGFELQTRMDDKPSNNLHDSTFQVAASWQANKNFLVKGKVGPLSSSLALAFKSWWKPSFTLSVSAVRDRTNAETSFGFGIRVDNIREASYQRADPNFVMLTPSKEHLAEGIHWKIGKRPMLQSDVDSGNFDGVPKELRPLNKIL
ncbi:hypothetical protein OROHE_017591 [Orobanche hederae]